MGTILCYTTITKSRSTLQTFQINSSRSDAWVRRQLVAAAGAALAAAELDVAGPLLCPLAEMLRNELEALVCTISAQNWISTLNTRYWLYLHLCA